MAERQRAVDKLKEGEGDYQSEANLEHLATGQGLGDLGEGSGDNRRAAAFSEIKGLCRTCVHAHITKRGSVEHTETTIRCGEIGKVMPPDIMECSAYWKIGQMSLRDMHEIAWYVDNREPTGGGGYR